MKGSSLTRTFSETDKQGELGNARLGRWLGTFVRRWVTVPVGDRVVGVEDVVHASAAGQAELGVQRLVLAAHQQEHGDGRTQPIRREGAREGELDRGSRKQEGRILYGCCLLPR
jgi:hypothetical protein